MKGYGVYKSLDELLEKDNMKKQYEFTFIGNLPKDIQFSNSRVLKPLHGLSLAQELKSHDILTASLNDHLEIIIWKVQCVVYQFCI